MLGFSSMTPYQRVSTHFSNYLAVPGRKPKGLRPWTVFQLHQLTRSVIRRKRLSCTRAIAEAPSQGRSDAAPNSLPTIPVCVSLPREVNVGEGLVLVGDHPAVGEWHVEGGVQMTWTEGHVWRAEVALPPGTSVEFKCVRMGKEGEPPEWEGGHNRVVHVPGEGRVRSMAVALEWGGSLEVSYEEATVPAAAANEAAPGWGREGKVGEKLDESWGSESEGEQQAPQLEPEAFLQEAEEAGGGEWDMPQPPPTPLPSGEEGAGEDAQSGDGRQSLVQALADRAAKHVASAEVEDLRKALEESDARVEAEREFSQKMVDALRTVRQQVAEAVEQQQVLERALRVEKDKVSQLENELASARAQLDQLSSAPAAPAPRQGASHSSGTSSPSPAPSSSFWDDPALPSHAPLTNGASQSIDRRQRSPPPRRPSPSRPPPMPSQRVGAPSSKRTPWRELLSDD